MSRAEGEFFEPPKSVWNWFQVFVGTTVCRTLIAAPLWYLVYWEGMSPETISESAATALLSLPAWQLIAPGLMMIAVVGFLGPVYALWQHERALEREGVDVHSGWLLVVLLGVNVWPVTWIAVWAHYHARFERYGFDSGGVEQ